MDFQRELETANKILLAGMKAGQEIERLHSAPVKALEWNARIATIKAMQTYGGGFVRALASAWQVADEQNSAKLEAAFPEYIEKYRLIAETIPKEKP